MTLCENNVASYNDLLYYDIDVLFDLYYWIVASKQLKNCYEDKAYKQAQQNSREK